MVLLNFNEKYVFSQVISTTMINSNSATSFLPFRTEFKDWNTSSTPSTQPASRRSSNASSQNSSLPAAESSTPTAVPSELSLPTVPTESSTVTHFFAAVNRIRNGEGFRLLGRRMGPNGKPQYLIEWRSNGNTSLF